MLEQVSERVHRVTGGATNFYLIEDKGKYTLVDAGTPRDWDLLEGSLRSLGAGPRDLEAVLLTHAHPDHVGFAEKARTDAGAHLWIHQADAEAARTGKPSWKNEGRLLSHVFRRAFLGTAYSFIVRGAARIIPVAEISSFAEGEVVDIPGSPRVLHTPGHTPGSAVVLLEERSTLLAGDAICTWNPFTGRLGPQVLPSALNMSTDQALASLDGLARVTANVLLPGHGDPWTGGIPEAIRRARAAGPS